ncbi:hypothetical protein UR09_03950 [Candidatus Nitromaritima sp. SCGC AAA799-A02]|nr:hypothetical protein UR09_03950 [Candidatus Nitromaritima sp. SCGC AAA799-A02]
MAEENPEENPEEEPEKKPRRKKGKKRRKKVRPQDDPPMDEVRERRPARRPVKKTARKPSRKAPWVTIVLTCVAVAWTYQAGMENKEVKALSDKYNMSLAALDRMYLGCKAFWTEKGIYDPCPLSVMEKTLGKLKQEVEFKILEGRSHAFSVQVKHKENDKLFQVDKEGKIFLNVNGCMAEVRFLELTPKDVQSLENQCQAPAR